MRATEKPAIPNEKSSGNADVPARLLRLSLAVRFAVLATGAEDGPRLSLVALAVTPDQRGVVFATPRKSEKFRNIKADGRVAILLDGSRGASGSVLDGETIAMNGTARVVRKGARREELAALLAARHPELVGFLSAPTTALVRIEVEWITHVEGFQRVTVLRRK
jgi:hypothetical protein